MERLIAGTLALVIYSSSVSVVPLFSSAPHPRHQDTNFIHNGQRSRLDIPTASAELDTFVLAEYDFDDPAGSPDTQGWTSRDPTVQPKYFHVEDFAGLGGGDFGGLSPLEGANSLWCGLRPDPVALCGWASLPGYGNGWIQDFESIAFPVSGDVGVTFLFRFNSEPSYDYTRMQYLTKTGRWHTQIDTDWWLPMYSADTLMTTTIPADSLDGFVKLRFHFTSDGAWSDKDGYFNSDGAVVIDSLTVTDSGGLIDYQDFESETVGDTITLDGEWAALSPSGFGDHAALFDGTTVLQEDSIVNTTNLWGFFCGSTYDYSCGGHPEQTAVAYGPPEGAGNKHEYLNNQILSPWIPLSDPYSGLLLEFDVYRDLPKNELVYYTWRVSYRVGDCPSEWLGDPQVYYHDDKKWFRAVFDISDYVPAEAIDMRVSIIALDMAWSWYGIWGPAECHSHAPLIDNVRVLGVGSITASEHEAGLPKAFALLQNYPNPFNPVTTIAYDVPKNDVHVKISIYDVSGRLVRDLLNKIHIAGRHTVAWDGRGDRGRLVATGVYFYRMVADDFVETRKMVLMK
jgi:hypothetical protein